MPSVMEEQPLLYQKKNDKNDDDDGQNDYSTSDLHFDHADADDNAPDPPSPGDGLIRRRTPSTGAHVSSLDFERIVNQYSIQAVRDRWLLPPLPADGSSTGHSRRQQQGDDDEEVATGGDDFAEHRNRRQTCQLKPQKRHVLGYSGWTAARWFLTALAGLLTGLASILIVSSTRL